MLILLQTDVVRVFQTKDLWDRHKMTTLPILRDRISQSFEHQVVAT